MQAHQALFTKSRSAVLGLLFTNPRRRYFLNELVREARMGRGTIQREVHRLLDAGLVIQAQEGRRIYYQANPESLILSELTSLMQKTTGPVGRLHQALEPLREKIDLAFIYGSIARGDESPSSDIDLMVIGSMSFGDVVDATSPLTEDLRREVNPSVFPRGEFRRRLQEGNAFLSRVVKGPKLFVIGGEHVLGELAQE